VACVQVMIHRAILGSVERMFAILLEHYAGKWPLWLSPRQVIVCPVSEKNHDYSRQVRTPACALGGKALGIPFYGFLRSFS
jgi:threonyl-tRNA synthetase